MRSTVLLPLLLFCLCHPLISAQQVGSFFTAIYLNGAPISSNQESCGNMGQPSYCCASGQSCAWDDGGKVACCASGSSCQGSAYGQGAGAGAGQYYPSSTSSWYPQQTTTIYQAQSQGCNYCQSTANYNGGGVVPIVPVTVATVLTPSTTTYYQVPTSTYSRYTQTTTTTPGAVVAVVTASNNAACPNGYTTLTEANVGAPVRTVGCNVIFNSGAWMAKGDIREAMKMSWTFSLMAMALWVA